MFSDSTRLIISTGSLLTLISGTLPLPAQARSLPGPIKGVRQQTQRPVKTPEPSQFGAVGSGTLVAMAGSQSGPAKELGKCPLKHTDVDVNISGYVSKVTVKQTFANPYKTKIEAVYTFPLSTSGAVDNMVMKIGQRTIKGTIRKREEARQIYEEARARGNVASLLDQERPNIFTQSVANIEPGKEVEITLQYIDLLPFEDGKYTFAFPTVVGPRFNPGNPQGKTGTGRHNDTDIVGDASKITPPIAPEGTRAGHDISIKLNIDAGVPIANIESRLHEVSIARDGNNKALVSLKNKSTIANKDFILSFDVAGDAIKSGYLTYRDEKAKDGSGFFTLMLLPPKKVTVEKVAPKEMIFLIDCSGSQSGMPLQKAKETLTYIIDHMNPRDTFQVISFNNGHQKMLPKPMSATAEMKTRARTFIKEMEAQGGTFMASAVEATCKLPAPENRLRIVTFMTDGYVGNDMEVLGLIKKMRGSSRWFSFGTGHSVNRFLIDGIANVGGGESEYVIASSKAGVTGSNFYKRIASPVLTDVKVDFQGVEVKEVFPKDVSDVWAQKPLYIKGRYLKPGAGTVTLSGYSAGKPYKQTLKVDFPASDPKNPGIASIWARAKVDRLMSEDWFGVQSGKPIKELKDEIVETALKHHIMTQYTSFVAVDESEITKGGKPSQVVVPVELPDGVTREGALGGSVAARPLERWKMQQSANFGSRGVVHNAPKARMLRQFGQKAAFRSLQIIDQSAARGNISDGSTPDLAPPPPARPYSQNQKVKGIISSDRFTASKLAESRPGDKDDARKDYARKNKKKESSKLNPLLVGLDSRIAGKDASLNKLTIEDGKVRIKISLNRPFGSVKAILERLGLTKIDNQKTSAKTMSVTGFIGPEKLSALSKLSFVIGIDPA